jgi:hypothetical protein
MASDLRPAIVTAQRAHGNRDAQRQSRTCLVSTRIDRCGRGVASSWRYVPIEITSNLSLVRLCIMTDTPRQAQSAAEVAGRFDDAWSTWLRASAADVGGSAKTHQPFEEFASALGGYAEVVSGPLRELAGQQRELADSMAKWAQLQRDLADQVETWAQQQRKIADTLETMLSPLTVLTTAAE